jgi:hypothetical protein
MSDSILQPTTPSSVLSAAERDRLAGLLALMPESRQWAIAHMHGPLLCVLGLVRPADAAYAHAVQRRFSDPADARRRALALIDELDRDARTRRNSRRHRGSRIGAA